jgi:hypothetical protein
MLKLLRNKKTAKKIWIGLGLIIVPAFIFWGLGGAIDGTTKKKYAGEISGKRISNLELNESLSALKNMLIMRYGENFRQIMKDFDLEGQAWQRLVLIQEAKKLKIEVSDKEVVEQIEKYPFFQRNGKFDNRAYNDLLKYTFNTQPRIFEEQIRQIIMLNKLYEQVTRNLVNVDEDEVRREYDRANQELSISYISSLTADFAKKIKPKDKELKDYFAKNREIFKDPAPATPDKKGKETRLPEFNSVKQRVKEAFVNAMALKKAEEKINQCAKELKSREFNKAARKCGLKVKDTPPFKSTDNIEGIGPAGTFWNTAKVLKKGEPSGIIRLPAGFYIIKVKHISELDNKKYEQEKAIIEQNLLNQKKQEKFNEFLAELDKNQDKFQ